MARWRLTALAISQSAHFMGNYCLRVYVVLLLASEGTTQRDTAWYLVAVLFMLPSIVFVPLYGAVGNSLPKRAVLVGSAAYCLSVVALFACIEQGWLACVACVALGSALYSPTRHALLPAAAHDTNLPLPRVVSAIETSAVLSIVGGMVLGGASMDATWEHIAAALCLPVGWAAGLANHGPPVTVAIFLSLGIICLMTAFPARFPSDVYRPESPRAALRGVYRDFVRLLRISPCRSSLVAVCLLRGLVTIAAGAMIVDTLARGVSPSRQYPSLILIAVLTMAGAGAGSFLAGLVGNRSQTLGLVPLGATALALAMAAIAFAPPAPSWLCVLVGVGGGLVNVPLLSTYQASIPTDARGNGMAILNTAGFVSMTALSLLVAGFAHVGILSASAQLGFVTVLSVLSAAGAWWFLGRSTGGLFVLPRLRHTSKGDEEDRPTRAASTNVEEEVA
jgi:MFS family permease